MYFRVFLSAILDKKHLLYLIMWGVGLMLEVSLLGQFQIIHDHKPLTISSRNAQSLFAYLILNAGKAFRREQLAGLLWPDSSEENARSNLRHELWRLRKAFGIGANQYIHNSDIMLSFRKDSPYWLDVEHLEMPALNASTTDDLIQSLSLYRGELLPGFYDEWVFSSRDRCQAIFESRAARLLEILPLEGRWTETIDWAQHWISLGQLPEPAYRALMAAHANMGDLPKAISIYERLKQDLKNNLGIQPSPQTQALLKQIRDGWMPAVIKFEKTAIAEPQKEPVSLTAAILKRSHIPEPLTSFIGREKETQELQKLVSSARLVTITGSGGVGKTRLANRIAKQMVPIFSEGVHWIELAPLFASERSLYFKEEMGDLLADPSKSKDPRVDAIILAVAKVLRVMESPDIALLDEVVEQTSEAHFLLILDNCEHLIDACALVAEHLLSNCPRLTILATSREALGIPGEKAWRLPSLPVPTNEDFRSRQRLLESDAVHLFIERTVDIKPGYQPTEAELVTISLICNRLSGIPLAIELAAARMNLLSAEEIHNRLDNRFEILTSGRRTSLRRHQTLQAAIEWSYDLLSEPEQILFRRLSIFTGSFSLEAAESVTTDSELGYQSVLDLMGRLVEKSLINVDPISYEVPLPTRYQYLDTIRPMGT
jgi:predicted ATPase/DNA-binding SARP family transcriptional activator